MHELSDQKVAKNTCGKELKVTLFGECHTLLLKFLF